MREEAAAVTEGADNGSGSDVGGGGCGSISNGGGGVVENRM